MMRHDPLPHGDDDTPRVYVIHENDAWMEPLRREFEAQGVPYAEWFLDRGLLDLSTEPPAGVFYSRMSTSSHNTNTNYSADAEALDGRRGMGETARYLGGLLVEARQASGAALVR